MNKNYESLNISDKNNPALFQTPVKVAQLMIKLADLKKNHSILEPSAGKGVIVEELLKQSFIPYVCELNEENHLHLQYHFGLGPIARDFMKLDDKRKFDRIIMNPPFKYAVEHIEKACDLLKPGGKIVVLSHRKALYRYPYTLVSIYCKHKLHDVDPKLFSSKDIDAVILVVDKK